MADDGNGDVEMAAEPGAGSEHGDDSSSEDFEVAPEVEQLIMQCEAHLEAQPKDYDTHVKLIGALKQARLKARLREARERMAGLFPLDEALWLDWVNDSMAALADEGDVAYIRALFQRAAQDYLSVSLLESHLQFLAAVDPEVSSKSAAGVQAFRQAAEAALAQAGLHLTEAHHLWEAYRSYEQALLEGGQGGDKQADAVRALYQRQLQTPSASADEVLREYEAWEGQHGKAEVAAHIRAAAARSKDAADLRASHEEAVAAGKPADAALLAAYTAYIALEKAQKQPARVQLLYERAVAAFPLTSQLWLQYAHYLEGEVRAAEPINKVYARAVRNCYWVGGLWEGALRALERSGAPDAALEALTQQALEAGLQGPEDFMAVILARADTLRHQLTQAQQQPGAAPAAPSGPLAPEAVASQLRAWFAQGRALMASRFPAVVDRSLRLPAYWAQLEGVVGGDLGAMRGVWEEAAKGQLGRYADTWLAWAAMERGLRQLPAARSLFKRALGQQLEEGGRLTLALQWLRFEREEGSADDLQAATLRLGPVLEEANAAAASGGAAAGDAMAAARQAPKLTREQVKAMRQANDPNYKERKPGVKRDALGDEVLHKRSRAREQQQQQQQQHGGGDVDMGEQQQQQVAAASFSAPARPGERVWHTDEHTVFVKGLGFSVGEEDLRGLFQGLGVKAVRMGLDRVTGKSRGFAYVEFESDDGVSGAVEKDGQEVKGRQLSIAKSAPPGGGGGGRGGGGGGRGGGGGGGFGRQPWGPGGGRGGAAAAAATATTTTAAAAAAGGALGVGFQPAAAPAAALMGHQKRHVELGGGDDQGGGDQARKGGGGAPLMPRLLVPKHAAGADHTPKTNDDFKKMLQSKPPPAAE